MTATLRVIELYYVYFSTLWAWYYHAKYNWYYHIYIFLIPIQILLRCHNVQRSLFITKFNLSSPTLRLFSFYGKQIDI